MTIMSSIADNIRKDFTEFSKRNKYIQQLIEKLENGKATLSEVDAITRATGYALKVAFAKNISENASAFADEDMLAEILRETFGDNYDMINAIAADVQKRLDKLDGINIRPQKAEFPNERVKNLAKFAAGKDISEEKTLSEFGAALENLNDSMFTDYVEANAKFRSEAGLRVYIIRSDSGRCCDWCAKLVGKYIYPDVPKDVWRRHKRCTCEITYVNERTGTADRIRFTDRKDGKKILTSKQVTRLTPEQARAKEREITAKNPLTFGRSNDTIKGKKFISAKSISEAEEYAKSTFTKTASFSGAKNLENVNLVNQTLTELTEEYPINSLQRVSTNNGLKKANARANGGSIEIRTSYLNAPDSPLDWSARVSSYPKMIADLEAKIESGAYSKNSVKQLKKAIKQMEDELQFDRWSVSSSSQNPLAATISHEYGHVLADQLFGQINGGTFCKNWAGTSDIRNMVNETFKKSQRTGDIHSISMYANSNRHEFFAECFAAHWCGEKLPDYIEKMLKEVLKK